jgi:pimeloyl-ACP methyl ester carboxylesterase
MEILFDEGEGRGFVVLCDSSSEMLIPLCQKLAASRRCILLKLPAVSSEQLSQQVEELRKLLDIQKVRQASFIAYEDAGVVLQQIVLEYPKRVRSLILIDAVTRPHPTKIETLYDWLEDKLPLGLPFRVRSLGVHFKPFLQRLRCPALVVRTNRTSDYLDREGEVLAHGLPTAWFVCWETFPDPSGILTAIHDFQDVPIKCPQKNLQRRAEGA